MIFQVLTAASLKMTVVEFDKRFEGDYRLHHQGDDKLNIFLFVCQFLPDYTTQHPKTQSCLKCNNNFLFIFAESIKSVQHLFPWIYTRIYC
jgi:hypothetical protein